MKYFLLVFLFLVACRELHSGKVIDKHFEPGYYSNEIIYIHNQPMPTTTWHEPEYRLTIEGYNKEGKRIQEYWFVSSGTYEYYPIGSIIRDTTTNF